MKNLSQGSDYFMILNATAPSFNMFNLIYSKNISYGQVYYVKYRAVNSVGPGPFSQVLSISSVGAPKAKKALVVEYIGANILISWKTSFEDNGSIISRYNILFGDNGGNY